MVPHLNIHYVCIKFLLVMKILRLLVVVLIIVQSSSSFLFGQVCTKVEKFNQVEIFGKLNVRLEKSESDSLFIQSGNFDVSKVSYTVKDSVLIIKLLSEFPPSIKVNVTVNFQQLGGLKAGGGAKVYNKGSIESDVFNLFAKSGCELDLLVNVDSANIKISKGAFLRLTGENRYLNLKITSGGDFRSTKMTNSEMVAILNGGTAEIQCSKFLDATVRMGATLKFVEQPNKIKRKEKFGGKISKLEDF